MDKLKTRVLFISLIILALVSIGAVAAADSVNDDVINANQEDFDLSEETNDVEQLGANAIDDTDSNEPLTAGESGTFSQLQELINGTPDGETLELDMNYTMTSDEKPIIVNKTITIDGKGHTLDAKNLNAIMSCIKPVTLKNIIFTNANCTDDYDWDHGYNIYYYGALNFNKDEYYDISCDGSIVDNCTFKNNQAYNGAGIYIFSDDVTVTNSRFEDNTQVKGYGKAGGAAIVIDGDNCVVKDSNFTGNTAENNGGAIFWTGSNGLIDGCNFTSNEAPNSGAVEYYLCNHQKIINSYFSKNKATSDSGGAISTASSTLDNITIDNCVFEDNIAVNTAGAIYIISIGPVNITNSKFYNNSADRSSGAIHLDAANVNMDNNEFINNTANQGGAIYIDYQNAESDNINITLSNSNFIENSAIYEGGAISSMSPDLTIDTCEFEKNFAGSTGQGGAISIGFALAKVNVTNSNFKENYAGYYGGAIYCTGTGSVIDHSTFVNNTIDYRGGAIYTQTGSNIIINNSKFEDNKAKLQYGGAAYIYGPNNIIDNCIFNNNTAPYGGAMWVSGQRDTIKNSNFTENTATKRAGAIYITSANVVVYNDEFRKNSAPEGGAIATQGTGLLVNVSVFEKNNATTGGAIYALGGAGNTNNLTINSTQFISNNATGSGGALMINIGGTTDINNSNFTMNKAFNGSAIYQSNGILIISNTELLDNQANAASLTASVEVEGFDATISTVFKGHDNLLNAIYTNNYANVKLTNVDYWGAEDKMNTGASEVTPVASADASEEGTLVYKDDREAGINITVTINDANGNFVKNVTGKTDIYGNINLSDLGLVPGKYNAKAIHMEDNYYTEIASSEMAFEIVKANSTVNGTNVTKVFNETIEVTIASENATAVIYNITDDKTGQVVVANTKVAANGTVTIPTLNVGNYTVHYLTVVDDVYYNNATNTSKITVTPAPSAIGAENVTIKFSEDAVLVASGENSTGIDSGSVVVRDSEGNVVETATVTVDGFKITISGLDAGNYTVSYNNTVDENHYSASNVTGVRVDPLDTTVSNNSASGKPGKNVTVDFTVNDEKGNPVSNGTLTVTVNGKEYTVDVKDGKATFENIVLPDTPGDYSYEVTYTGTNNYNPSVGQLNLTVQKVDVIVTLPEVINYTGAVVDIVVDVVDEYGNIVNEGTVTLTIDWGTKLSDKLMATAETHTVEVSNGKATFSGITLGEPGTYPSKAEYSGSDYYNEAENKSDVIVLPLNTTTESQDVSGKAGDKKDITADIVDQNGNPVKNGTAVLKLNGKEYTAEVKDGKATFKGVELPSESTEATIDYLGNDYYNPSKTTIQITINEEPKPEPEPQPEPVNPVTEKTVPVIPAAGNPIALVVVALLALVSTVSFGRKK